MSMGRIAAMDSEMDSLRENGAYEIVDKPVGKIVVKSKWVLRVKTNEKGEVEMYKARVVAKGFIFLFFLLLWRAKSKDLCAWVRAFCAPSSLTQKDAPL